MSKLLVLLIFVTSIVLVGCSSGDSAAPVGQTATSKDGQEAVNNGKVTRPSKPSTD